MSTTEADVTETIVADSTTTTTTVETTTSTTSAASSADGVTVNGTEPERIIEASVPRRRTLPIGSALLTASTLMYFGGLFGIYLSERSQHLARNAGEDGVPWFADNVQVELGPPTLLAWTLLMSIPVMQWAVYSYKRNDRRHGLVALLVNAVFAAAVINANVFQWNQLGFVNDDLASAAPPLLYAITGSFLVAMIVALIAFAILALRTLSGSTTSQHTDSAAAVAVYWYGLVVLYFIIWILIFITK